MNNVMKYFFWILLITGCTLNITISEEKDVEGDLNEAPSTSPIIEVTPLENEE